MNQQPPEKQNLQSPGVLQVHSIFRTIQGEGPFTGQRAVFIRLAGCNLQCPLCDTDYTDKRKELSVMTIMDHVIAIGNPGILVVITGGEPFRQNLSWLVEALLADGYRVQIETNGTLYQDLPFDKITVVCSPKTGSVNKKLQPHIHSLKYVLRAGYIMADGLPISALDHSASPILARPWPEFRGTVYVQPVDIPGSDNAHLDATIASVMRNGYTLCLQTHKIIGLE